VCKYTVRVTTDEVTKPRQSCWLLLLNNNIKYTTNGINATNMLLKTV